jgi:hypothetical protein
VLEEKKAGDVDAGGQQSITKKETKMKQENWNDDAPLDEVQKQFIKEFDKSSAIAFTGLSESEVEKLLNESGEEITHEEREAMRARERSAINRAAGLSYRYGRITELSKAMRAVQNAHHSVERAMHIRRTNSLDAGELDWLFDPVYRFLLKELAKTEGQL